MIIAHVRMPPLESSASYRYRTVIPGVELTRLGHEVIITPEPVSGAVHVYHKYHLDEDQHLAELLPLTGGVYDITDDHFDQPLRDIGRLYRRMAAQATALTCSSEALAARILGVTGRNAVVIPDPYEYPEAPHTWRGGFRILWYGHPLNFATLRNVELDGPLEIITECKPGGHTNVIMTPWSHETMLRGFERADVVILPQLDDPKSQAKSPNRLVNALRQGRFVVASRTPAYQEFEDYVYLTDDRERGMMEGVQWARAHPEAVSAMVTAGQAYVAERYSPARVAQQWLTVLEGILPYEAKPGLRQQTA